MTTTAPWPTLRSLRGRHHSPPAPVHAPRLAVTPSAALLGRSVAVPYLGDPLCSGLAPQLPPVRTRRGSFIRRASAGPQMWRQADASEEARRATCGAKRAVGQANALIHSGQTVAYARGVRRKRSLTPRKMNGDSTMRTAATPQRVLALPQWTDAQEDGLACVVCGLDYTSPAAKGVISMPVGRCATTASSVFACACCCGEGDE